MKYHEKTMTHLRLNQECLLSLINSGGAKPTTPLVQKTPLQCALSSHSTGPLGTTPISTTETTAENTAEISTCLAVPAQAKAGGILLTNDQGKLIGTTKEEKLENKKNAKDAPYGSENKSAVLRPPKFLAIEGGSDLPTLEEIEANADQGWSVSEYKPYPEVTGAFVELGEYECP